jgi:hypothetical protein
LSYSGEFIYSDWSNGGEFYVSYWAPICPGELIVFDICNDFDRYGNTGVLYGHGNYANIYSGGFSSYTCSSHSSSGYHAEYVYTNSYGNCDAFHFHMRCSYSAAYGNNCGGVLTTKIFRNVLAPSANAVEQERSCYDLSRYFCQNNCSSVVLDNGCIDNFGSTWAKCPDNAICFDGKYHCKAGFKDLFQIDTPVLFYNGSFLSSCELCDIPKGCVPDADWKAPSHNFTKLPAIDYQVDHSLSNSQNYEEVNITSEVCGKTVIVEGCNGNSFGDQYFELMSDDNTRYHNDDSGNAHACASIQTHVYNCDNSGEVLLKLGCFGTSKCGGSVEISYGVVVDCPPNTYSSDGFAPCSPCKEGTTNFGHGNKYCDYCTADFVGFNGEAPCVRCPSYALPYRNTMCIVCNSQTLLTMSGDVHNFCLSHILKEFEMMQQSVIELRNMFEQYLIDTKYGMPTFPPTPTPTRRRRSRAPTML